MNQSSTWRQFKLLMWKSMMIRKRHWFYLLLELLLPIVVFFGYAVGIQYYHSFTQDTNENKKQTLEIDLRKLNSNFDYSIKLCYYPTVDFTKRLMKKVQSKLKLNAENVFDFKNESSFLDYFKNTNENNSIFAITFQNLNSSAFPQDLVYFIKPYIKGINRNKGSHKYIKKSLLSLQVALEASFVETVTKHFLVFKKAVHEFSHSQRGADSENITFFSVALPMLIGMAFMTTVAVSLTSPTLEKATGIKELMKSSGINSWLIYVGWVSHHIIINIVSILISIISLTVPIWKANDALIKYCSFSVLFIFLFIFCLSIITYSLFISSWFHQEYNAQFVGVGLWCLIPGVINTNGITNKSIIMVLSLFPPFTTHFVSQQLGIYDLKKTEANLSNIHKSVNGDANAVTIADIIIMLFVSCIIYSIMALYVEQVRPGPYGVAKPFYFFIQYISIYWKKMFKPSRVESEISFFVADVRTVEPPASTLKPGIRIKQLCKTYGNYRAVENLSIDIYEGLITVLLGQNGAGKTTIMSIITGMVKATSGKVFVDGEDIQYNMDVIRCSLGYCPQNNINFEALTVMDHFVFFGVLKGQDKAHATSQAKNVLNELNLYEHRAKGAKKLSGGMQRRLSLGIALMGNSKILILDEPTSGLDPETRRELWDILLQLKKTRTVLITTHSMEEADALADRIAIIDHGHLTCYGTPLFLKKLYGSGYNLTLIRDKNLFEEKYPGGNQIDTVTKLIKGKLKEATLYNSNFNCLTYGLPYDKKSQYGALLSDIENAKEAICITHIELSITTLEEVFLKAGSFGGKDDQELKSSLQCSASLGNTKFKSINLQFQTLVQKRWLLLKRRYLVYIIPAIFSMVWCVGVVHATYKYLGMPKTTNEKRLNNYGRTTIYHSTNNKTDDIPTEELNSANSILKALHIKNYSITSIITPLRDDQFRFNSDDEPDGVNDVIVKIFWIIVYPIGMMFLVLPFVVLPQKETITNLKQLQLMCGVNPLLYWCVCFIMDFLFYFIWVLIMVTIMYIYVLFGLPLFDHISFCLQLMAILVAYGMAVIPYTYLFSNAKKLLDTIVLYTYSAILVAPTLILFVGLETLPSWSHYIFILHPQYGLLSILLNFCTKALATKMWKEALTPELCKSHKHPCCGQAKTKKCDEMYNDVFGNVNKKMYYHLLITIASTCLYFAILVLLERQFFQTLFENIIMLIYQPKKKKTVDSTNREDVELVQEKITEIMKRKLNQGDNIPAEYNKTALIAHNLQKSFKRVTVVKNISFSVDVGECFGLLGVNGAGKTTTFRMLTGNLPIMKGECRVATPSGQIFYLSKSPKEYFSNIGYCPQFDIIDEILTGHEMLTLFGKLRGLYDGLNDEIKLYAKCLGFDDIVNRACGGYSGGNKRKLCIAMAMIGVPPVILMDEPTSGVDPIARRALWNMVKLMQRQKIKPAMVLTTHSIEECEVLCNKVAIMKDGEFQCYGTIPQLKTKYAQGFTVTLKLLAENNSAEQQAAKVQSLKLRFQQMYKGSCELKDEYVSLLKYHISDLNKKWSDIFKDMEQLLKEFAIIEDYTISETTLEEVFIMIARTN